MLKLVKSGERDIKLIRTRSKEKTEASLRKLSEEQLTELSGKLNAIIVKLVAEKIAERLCDD